jgi:glycosyltransferase involved in cell wall biosynthesis
VLLLIKGLGPGGAEQLVSMAAHLRDRQDFDYEVAYLLPWKNALVEDLGRAGVAVHCLKGGREWNLSWAARLRTTLLRHPVDIVHIHSPYVAGISRLVVRSLPRRVRPRLMSTEHLPWSGYAPPTRILNAMTFPLDDAHVAVSEAVRNSIPRLLADRVRVIVHGIALSSVQSHRRYRQAARAELAVAPGDLMVGTVANLRPQKGYPDLLRAARRVVDQGVPVRFFAMGQGALEEGLRRMHRSLGLGDRFVFLGYRENPARILAGCDLFAMASLYEGLSLAMMEALALGLPVVATAVPGVREVVTDDVEALLVPPSSPELLADAIVRLARDRDRLARMGRAALKRAGDFDIEKAVRETEALYREIVLPGGSPKRWVDARLPTSGPPKR